ncbi:N-acetylmuramoyl-L-alanine amidase [Micromonospora sp. NBC_01405]|uniref:golvesin C-terminal-like domain-containing protein n=1 Tax=Micromonospora sp. NBC_01405 TaxID=2903589 RepID=UPI00324A51E2
MSSFGNSAVRRRTLLATAAGVLAAPLLAGRAQAALPRVYIDPGHGGTDSGAVGNGLQEKNLTLAISLQVRDILLANYSVDVRMSRTTDLTRSLAYRTDDANAWGANIFVSIHINSGGGTGFESYRYPSGGSGDLSLHNALHPRIISGMRSIGSVTDRGQKTANFHVLRESAMPAVLTENLFIDSVADTNLLKRADFITAVARAHAQGIAAYLGLATTPPPTSFSTIVDNATAGRFTASANWSSSAYSAQRYGTEYRFANPVLESDAAWFKVNIPAAGNHRVDVWYPADAGYNSSAPHVVVTAAGNQTVNVDQRTGGGAWRSIGTFNLAAGDRNLVGVSRWTNAAGYVIADAVRVTRV